MKYMGSKNRHAKDLLPIILKDRQPNQWYVEPFCGGCNVIDKVIGPRIANDSHVYLIELLKAIQTGWIPPDYITETHYKDVMNNKDKYPLHLVGFIGFCCSFGGKWFGGFARNVRKSHPDADTLNSTTRNYCAESKRNLIKQAPDLIGINFYNTTYSSLPIPDNSIIYCDPPYKHTTGYKSKFDHDVFWQWVREVSNKGHSVFISEYNAPSDFECIWEKPTKNHIGLGADNNRVERLFIFSCHG